MSFHKNYITFNDYWFNFLFFLLTFKHFTDDFSPVLALSDRSIFVWPIRLPTKINSRDDPELKMTMTKLREARMHYFILHTLKKDVVLNVLHAVRFLLLP